MKVYAVIMANVHVGCNPLLSIEEEIRFAQRKPRVSCIGVFASKKLANVVRREFVKQYEGAKPVNVNKRTGVLSFCTETDMGLFVLCVWVQEVQAFL